MYDEHAKLQRPHDCIVLKIKMRELRMRFLNETSKAR